MQTKRKPYELNLTAYALPLKRFTHDPAAKTLTAFESDLRDRPFDGTYPWLRRLYSDACDVGMAICSHHTSRLETFVLARELLSADGELQGWEFRPTPDNKTELTVTIFND